MLLSIFFCINLHFCCFFTCFEWTILKAKRQDTEATLTRKRKQISKQTDKGIRSVAQPLCIVDNDQAAATCAFTIFTGHDRFTREQQLGVFATTAVTLCRGLCWALWVLRDLCHWSNCHYKPAFACWRGWKCSLGPRVHCLLVKFTCWRIMCLSWLCTHFLWQFASTGWGHGKKLTC